MAAVRKDDVATDFPDEIESVKAGRPKRRVRFHVGDGFGFVVFPSPF